MAAKEFQDWDDAILDLMNKGMIVVILDEDGIIGYDLPIWRTATPIKDRHI